jgi:hypothetical protein
MARRACQERIPPTTADSNAQKQKVRYWENRPTESFCVQPSSRGKNPFLSMCCELGTELTHLQDRNRELGDGKGTRQIGLVALGLLNAGC